MFPIIPRDLLEELNQRFPKESPTISETERELMWRGGQRSVIEFLNTTYVDQEASRLGEI